MSKKSQAPWSYKKAKWEDGFSILDADGDPVTESGCGCCSPKDVGVWLEDDARLIAAAPCLLEALEMVINDMAPTYHDCIDDGLSECAWCIARKAIAKAKGESQ
jgi:hypothetical protein